MSKHKSIKLRDGRTLGDLSKNELIRLLVDAANIVTKYDYNLTIYAAANKKLREQNEWFKKRLRK